MHFITLEMEIVFHYYYYFQYLMSESQMIHKHNSSSMVGDSSMTF